MDQTAGKISCDFFIDDRAIQVSELDKLKEIMEK